MIWPMKKKSSNVHHFHEARTVIIPIAMAITTEVLITPPDFLVSRTKSCTAPSSFSPRSNGLPCFFVGKTWISGGAGQHDGP